MTLAFAHRRALAVDPRTLGGRVLLRQESADRDHVAVGIGEPVGGAELHGLDQMMEIVDGVVAEALEVVALEDIEGLEHLERGERRRHREHLAVSIGDRGRLSPFGRERGQVLFTEPPAGLAHRTGDRARDWSAVEDFRAALRHLAERRRELLVGHDPTRARSPVAQIEALRLRRTGECRTRRLEELDILERERHAVLGERDRRRQHPRAVHRAEALERGEPAPEIARSRARLGAADQLIVRAGGRIRGGGRSTDEVEHVALAPARDQHEADPAGARHERLHHVQSRADGHCSIDGIAAGQQHLDPGHRGERVSGGDDAASPHDARSVGVSMWWHVISPVVASFIHRVYAIGRSLRWRRRHVAPTRARIVRAP